MSEQTGGFIDIAPLMLEKLRKAAHDQAGKNTYTWIAPGHVLALLATIDELEVALAGTTAKLIRASLAQNAPDAPVERFDPRTNDGTEEKR